MFLEYNSLNSTNKFLSIKNIVKNGRDKFISLANKINTNYHRQHTFVKTKRDSYDSIQAGSISLFYLLSL